MEKKAKLPVIHLELNAGVFKISTQEAIYEISVNPESSLTRIVDQIVEKEIVAEPAASAQKPSFEEVSPSAGNTMKSAAADSFYKEVSEEMFKEIGKVARTLSLSIKDIPDGAVEKVDFEKAGIDLESAKGSLEDIVKITEKATMDIMDMHDSISGNCDTIKKNLSDIRKLHFIEKHVEGDSGDSALISCEFLEDIIKKEEGLKNLIKELPESHKEPSSTGHEPEPATEKVRVYKFDLDVVLQTLYELCTNESVKKNHITPMRADKDSEFDIDGVLKAFSDMAPNIATEENFFNFPVTDILKILFRFSKSEKSKQVLKKMNQTADSIFLDQVLPIEGSVEEKEVTVANETKTAPPSDESDSGPRQKALKLIDENIGDLKKETERFRAAVHEGESTDPEGISMIKTEDREILVSALESTENVIQKIISNLTSILESLTFQDLSGQRIKKIVAVLTDIQIQMLSTLVSFGTKLKIKKNEKDVTPGEAEAKASREVDRMMEMVADEAAKGKDTPGPLDQNAVNDLLAELGF